MKKNLVQRFKAAITRWLGAACMGCLESSTLPPGSLKLWAPSLHTHRKHRTPAHSHGGQR